MWPEGVNQDEEQLKLLSMVVLMRPSVKQTFTGTA